MKSPPNISQIKKTHLNSRKNIFHKCLKDKTPMRKKKYKSTIIATNKISQTTTLFKRPMKKNTRRIKKTLTKKINQTGLINKISEKRMMTKTEIIKMRRIKNKMKIAMKNKIAKMRWKITKLCRNLISKTWIKMKAATRTLIQNNQIKNWMLSKTTNHAYNFKNPSPKKTKTMMMKVIEDEL